MRLAPFAVWAAQLRSDEDLFEAVRLYCLLTHSHELVVEASYIYCYTIRYLITSESCSPLDAYNKARDELERRSVLTGISSIKYWFENEIEIDDVDEMPKAHERPVSYLKTPLLWAFYYLKHEYTLNRALKEMIM